MANALLILHALVVLFFVAGFPLGLVLNHRLFRLIHISALAGVILLMLLGIPCPLTLWEEMLRDGSYGGSFIAYWLSRIIYLEGLTARTVFYIDLAFFAAVVSSFWWRPLPPGRPSR